jgi:hypothetical protein
VAEAWGQFWKAEEREHPLLEAVTRRKVKTVIKDIHSFIYLIFHRSHQEYILIWMWNLCVM